MNCSVLLLSTKLHRVVFLFILIPINSEFSALSISSWNKILSLLSFKCNYNSNDTIVIHERIWKKIYKCHSIIQK